MDLLSFGGQHIYDVKKQSGFQIIETLVNIKGFSQLQGFRVHGHQEYQH